MNNNATQKQIIKVLTETHQDPATAFKILLDKAINKEQAEQIKRIAGAFKIDLRIKEQTKTAESEIILNLLENDLKERTENISKIIKRIEENEIKHSSKAKKEKDLYIQTGYKIALETIKSNLHYFKTMQGVKND